MSMSSMTALLLLLLWSCAVAGPAPTTSSQPRSDFHSQSVQTAGPARLRAVHSNTHPVIPSIEGLQEFLASNENFQVHSAVESAMQQFQSPELVKAVGMQDSTQLFPLLMKKFAQYEIPVGVTSKLLEIQHYDKICFLIDDSGSMSANVRNDDPNQDPSRKQALDQLSKELHHKSVREWVQNGEKYLDQLPDTYQKKLATWSLRQSYQDLLGALRKKFNLFSWNMQSLYRMKGDQWTEDQRARFQSLSSALHDSVQKWVHEDATAYDAISTKFTPLWRHQIVQEGPTRWSEACNQVLQMLDILQYIPRPTIEVHFLNRPTTLTLRSGDGRDPQTFYEDSRRQILDEFAKGPLLGTPMFERIKHVMEYYRGEKVIHYWFGDGAPDGKDTEVARIKRLVQNRPDPQNTPITFVSCSDNDAEIAWMKEIEEIAPYCAEIDDYASELKEVIKDQGEGFRHKYKYGLYLISLLVGAMNPNDLDALDEAVPLTKYSLELLMGYTEAAPYSSYERYFCDVIRAQEAHPDRKLDMLAIVRNYMEFVKAGVVALDLGVVQRFRRCLKEDDGMKLMRPRFQFTSVKDYLKKLRRLDILDVYCQLEVAKILLKYDAQIQVWNRKVDDCDDRIDNDKFETRDEKEACRQSKYGFQRQILLLKEKCSRECQSRQWKYALPKYLNRFFRS